MWGEYVSATLTDTHPRSTSVSSADRYAPPRDTFMWGYGSVVTPIDRGVFPSKT